MSDSITVRVTLDSYDIAHPSEKQTQVYVQIPEVARASWLLNAGLFTGLKLSPWPGVVDAAIEDYDVRHVVADAASANARAAVRAWLRDDANRAEMQAAYELDQARRSPITRKLLDENGRLLARVAELETEREKLVRWHGEDNATINRLVARVERRQAQLVALRNDALSMRGSLAPADGHRKVPFELGETLTPAVDWLIARVAELEAAPTTVYRASHDSIVMGLYTTAAEARRHCETELRRDTPPSLELDWIEDSEDDTAELVVVCSEGGRWTGYVVTALEVAAEYDPDGDE